MRAMRHGNLRSMLLAVAVLIADDAAAQPGATDPFIETTMGACRSDLAQCERDCAANAASDACWAFATTVSDGVAPTLDSNPRRGRELAHRSCTAGNPTGCRALQIIGNHDAGCSDIASCQTRCDAGVGNACVLLGQTYENGTGVPRNPARAFAFYQKGCDAEASRACFLVGGAYLQGSVVPRNVQTARDPLVKACDLGEMLACQAFCELLGTSRFVEPRCGGALPHSAWATSRPRTVSPVVTAQTSGAQPPLVEARFVGKHGEQITVKNDAQVTVTSAAGAVLSASGCGVTPYSNVVAFMTDVQGMVARGDWAGLSARSTFPLITPVGGIPDAATFVSRAPAIFTPPIRAAIADAEAKAAFCNVRGFMLGSGVLWGNADASGRYGLTMVNAVASRR